MKFLILYATLSISHPINLGLWQDVVPKLRVHRSFDMVLNPTDNSSAEERALQKLGYMDVENNIQLNYVYNIQ
jgi:hypothetical protein